VARLFLVRHAESEGNRDRVFTATPHVPLTERGRAQARATAAWLDANHRPGRIVSSPFARARETADIIGGRLQLPVAIEEDLRERDYGLLAGLPYATPRSDYDPLRYWLWRPEGGRAWSRWPPGSARCSTGWPPSRLRTTSSSFATAP